ncbi:MAG: PAS domain S-box protein, partial [Anaerolineales bacterium]|nr:PAS domain S-box protein [Anaerolineales bacterium]
MNRLNITPKLTLVFILFGIVLLLGLAIPIYYNFRSALENTTTSELQSASIEKEAAINNWIAERTLDLETTATHPHLITRVENLVNNHPGSDTIPSVYDDLLGSLVLHTGSRKQFEEIMLLAPESGQIILSTNPTDEGMFMENRPFFINGKNGTFVQTLYFSASKQAPAMTISTPIRSADGRLLVVMAVRLHLTEMEAIINRRSGLRQSDDSFLVNTASLFVTQPRFLVDPAVLRIGNNTPAINNCLQFNNGVSTLDDYRGIPVITVYRWLPSQKLCLLVEIDQSEAFAPVRRLVTTMAITGVLVLLIGSLIGFVIARSFTKPIHQLVMGAEEIGRGNLDGRIEIEASDEIGLLAQAFNQMVVSLKTTTASRDELDKEVVYRKQAEVDLINERDKAQQYLDVAGTIFVIIDADQTVSLINQAGFRVLGFEGDEIIGQNWFDTCIPERNRQEVSEVFKLLLSGEIEPIEFFENPVLTKDGSERIIAWHNTLLFNDEGKIEGALSSGEDITERRKAEEDLRIKDFAFQSSISADSIGSNEGLLIYVNTAFAQMWGYENVDEV